MKKQTRFGLICLISIPVFLHAMNDDGKQPNCDKNSQSREAFIQSHTAGCSTQEVEAFEASNGTAPPEGSYGQNFTSFASSHSSHDAMRQHFAHKLTFDRRFPHTKDIMGKLTHKLDTLWDLDSMFVNHALLQCPLATHSVAHNDNRHEKPRERSARGHSSLRCKRSADDRAYNADTDTEGEQQHTRSMRRRFNSDDSQ